MCNQRRLPYSLGLFAILASCASTAPVGTGRGSDDAAIGDGRIDTSGAHDLRGAGGDSGGGPQPDFAGTQVDLTAAPDLTQPVDLSTPPDLVPLGKDVGQMCAADAECASGKCLDEYQGNKFCVAACKAMGDCAGYMTSFCEPQSPGSPNGYCIPRHPAHCASCAKDADCGSLAERCLQAPGDIATACHIDCAIDGANACPNDYSCTAVTDGNTMRKLCLPNSKICLDAIGGWCDRIALPQSCSRQNASGLCTGQRPCIVNSKRYDKCGALAPQYKTCGQQDPAGCMLNVDPSSLTTKLNCGKCGLACGAGQDCCGGACTQLGTAMNCAACGMACAAGQGCCGGACTPLGTIQNCGACGTICPGQTNTSDALCTGGKCDMTCRGDNYDVDKSAVNGCEIIDIVPPGHTQQTAASRGNKPCDDTASKDTFNANAPSDARVHVNPAVIGFVAAVGDAPDYWSINATGGNFCVDDYSVTFSTQGGGNTQCYRCTIITNKLTNVVTVTGNGSATMSGGSGSYSDGTTIYFLIEKTCNLPVQEAVTYTVSYHL